jgi:hypothetical protein
MEVFYRDHLKLLPSILTLDKPLNLYIILEYRYPPLPGVLINRRLLIQPLLYFTLMVDFRSFFKNQEIRDFLVIKIFHCVYRKVIFLNNYLNGTDFFAWH